MTNNILLEMITDLPEVQVYMVVEGARRNTASLSECSSEISSDEVMIRTKTNVLECIQSLTRFGLDTPLSPEGQPSNQYWAWQRWWRKYLGSLSEIEFQELMDAIKFKEEVSSWRPQRSWKVGY